MAALIYNSFGDADSKRIMAKQIENFASVAKKFTPVKLYDYGSDELFVGRAGYLLGVLNLR